MNKSLLILVGFVLGGAGGATWLALDQNQPAAAAALPALAPLPPQLEEVLVATHKLSSGSVVQASDLAWQGWPRDTALRGVIRKSEAPAAMDEIKDSVARGAFLAGEPIRRDKLVKGGDPANLSAILAPGHSAVAINIEGGAAANGGSILPNDYVDVIRASKTALRSGEAGKTLVANVRLLAIAPNAQRGPTSATGSTATLELDPDQAETVILGHRGGGQLSLAPHATQDTRKSEHFLALDEKHDRGVNLVRASATSR
jgi:pilus assembly protein CpaB